MARPNSNLLSATRDSFQRAFEQLGPLEQPGALRLGSKAGHNTRMGSRLDQGDL
jgi:hypothetical protein